MLINRPSYIAHILNAHAAGKGSGDPSVAGVVLGQVKGDRPPPATTRFAFINGSDTLTVELLKLYLRSQGQMNPLPFIKSGKKSFLSDLQRLSSTSFRQIFWGNDRIAHLMIYTDFGSLTLFHPVKITPDL